MDHLTLAVDVAGIATLTLNRPDKHNALNAAMIAELAEATRRIADDDGIHAAVLTGSGRSFCAGADLNWMRMQFDATRSERIDQARALASMLDGLNRLPKPLIGRINGPAYGGGLGLMAVCDAAIAATNAKFAFTETRLGIIPATIGPFVMARMGEAAARRVFFSARPFGPAEAVTLGLAAATSDQDALDDAVMAELSPYAATEPAAVARAKALTRSLGMQIDADTLERTAEALADAWESPQARQRIGAFLAEA